MSPQAYVCTGVTIAGGELFHARPCPVHPEAGCPTCGLRWSQMCSDGYHVSLRPVVVIGDPQRPNEIGIYPPMAMMLRRAEREWVDRIRGGRH